MGLGAGIGAKITLAYVQCTIMTSVDSGEVIYELLNGEATEEPPDTPEPGDSSEPEWPIPDLPGWTPSQG